MAQLLHRFLPVWTVIVRAKQTKFAFWNTAATLKHFCDYFQRCRRIKVSAALKNTCTIWVLPLVKLQFGNQFLGRADALQRQTKRKLLVRCGAEANP